jgi:hypothetical protein
MSDANLKTYQGGCHCGTVRYAVDLDFSSGLKAHKCNCSICLKVNRTAIIVKNPATHFELLSPASLDDVTNYTFGTKTQDNRFCTTCGVHLFSSGTFTIGGKTMTHFGVNAVTLDPGQGIDLRELKVGYWDGENDNFEAGPQEKPAMGGIF